MAENFVSLNKVFLPSVGGGQIEGDLEINGKLTVNDKSGNGTFLDIVDEINDIPVAADYIISREVKIDSNGCYHTHTKWNSGYYEYTKYYQDITVDCTTAHGSGYYCDKKDWYFPPMKNVYFISMFQAAGTGGSWFQVFKYSGAAEKFTFRVFNTVNDTRTIDIAIHVIGTWK